MYFFGFLFRKRKKIFLRERLSKGGINQALKQYGFIKVIFEIYEFA